ncbi:uncharacterized protein RB166_006940 [Leptodactylus fuscus]
MTFLKDVLNSSQDTTRELSGMLSACCGQPLDKLQGIHRANEALQVELDEPPNTCFIPGSDGSGPWSIDSVYKAEKQSPVGNHQQADVDNFLLCGFQQLLGAGGGFGGGSPISVWGAAGQVAAQGASAVASRGGGPLGGVGSSPPVPVVDDTGSGLAAGYLGASPGAVVGGAHTGEVVPSAEVAKVRDEVRMADSAKGEVYVCFEGPLGVHLKPEVRERIWKGEYVEIFSLLPLEKFNLDRVKPDECKKEEEERRRYRLIPRTFSNWLQAFCILASVVGERAPEDCSALFCYLDSIGDAYRVYGGNAWLRYDEHFRQRKAVRPSLRWDHKDISSWMKLMAATKGGGGQSFREGAGGSESSSGRSAGGGRGCCWQYNEGQCKFGNDCRFKHECSGCGGAHPLTRCFKKGKGKGGDTDNKRGDAGEGGKDGGVSRAISK